MSGPAEGATRRSATALEERTPDQRIGSSWRELRRSAAAGRLRDRLYGTGDDALDLGQVDTLDLLVQRDGWRMSELAEALRVDASSATRAIGRLVQAGLALRTASPGDARGVVVAATKEGRRRHDAIAERRRVAMAEILAGFDAADRRALADLLERLVSGLDAYTATDAPPADA